MSPLLMILLGILVLGLKQGFELILENEYATWAPALARLFVRVAGFVYWPRRDQWEADLRYLQQVEDQSGLLPAGWCLLSAPGLMLRRVAAAFGDLKPVTLSGPKAVVKRAFDVVVAMLVLLAACPLMVVAAVAVRLTSP